MRKLERHEGVLGEIRRTDERTETHTREEVGKSQSCNKNDTVGNLGEFGVKFRLVFFH